MEAGMAVGYQLQWGSPVAFLTAWVGSACNYIFPWRMFHIPGIFNFCDLTNLHSTASHIITSWAAQGGEGETTPGRTHHDSSCYLLYTSEPIWKPQAFSLYQLFPHNTVLLRYKYPLFLLNPFSIRFHFYSVQNSAFSSCGTSWLRMGQEGKELFHKVNRFTCVLRPHCCFIGFHTMWAQRLSRIGRPKQMLKIYV